MDSFEDVELDSPVNSTEDGANDGQDSSRHTNGLSNDAKSRDCEAKCLEAVRLRVPSEQAYHQASLSFHTDTGTPYPCSQNDLDAHSTDRFQEQSHRPFVGAMEATREVMLHNHVSRRIPPTELAAIENLRQIVYAVEKRMDFGPDLAVKAFSDLDLMFFDGQLRDNVHVQWVKPNDDPEFAALRRVWGATMRPSKPGKCLIKLNADLHLRQSHEVDPLRLMFGTLLHEMCHAYQTVRCGYIPVKRPGHDEFFGTRIAVVHERAMRVLGLWAIGKNEPYRQYHFFPGEQTAMDMVMTRMLDIAMDVDDKMVKAMDRAAETAARGIAAVKRWM